MRKSEELGVDINDLLRHPKDNVVTMFLSGSQFDGFGHNQSDIDLFIVSKTKQVDLGEFTFNIDYISDKRIDVEYWSLDDINDLIEKLNGYMDGERGPHAQPYISLKARDLLHRMSIGEAIFGFDEFNDLKRRLNLRALSEINYWLYYTNYIGAQEDAVGLIESGDIESAHIACRITLESAFDCLTCFSGDNNLGEKWRFRRLRRNGLSDALIRYQDFLRGESSDDLKLFLEDYLNYANDVILMTSKQE